MTRGSVDECRGGGGLGAGGVCGAQLRLRSLGLNLLPLVELLLWCISYICCITKCPQM
jgi:hypothetical protein